MQPSLVERIARIRALCADLEAVSVEDLAQITLRAEALQHEAGLLAADAADAVARRRRKSLHLTAGSAAPDTPGGHD